jgi:hypothetical protein
VVLYVLLPQPLQNFGPEDGAITAAGTGAREPAEALTAEMGLKKKKKEHTHTSEVPKRKHTKTATWTKRERERHIYIYIY